MSKDNIIDAGDLRKYRIEIPNSVDDLGLDPYTVRLYMHLKRVAGPDGECWQSAKTIATHCKMSTGQVSKSKQILKEKHLITITHIKHEKPGKPYHVITIRDIWLHNFQKYAQTSPHDVQTSPHDVQRSQGDLKNKPCKNKPLKKESAETAGPEPKSITEHFEDVIEYLRTSPGGPKAFIAATAEFCALCFGGEPEYGRVGRIAKKHRNQYRRICQVALECIARSPRGDPYSYLEACLKGGHDKERQTLHSGRGPRHHVADQQEFEQARRDAQERNAADTAG